MKENRIGFFPCFGGGTEFGGMAFGAAVGGFAHLPRGIFNCLLIKEIQKTFGKQRALLRGCAGGWNGCGKSKPKKTMAICIRCDEGEFSGFRAFADEIGIPLAELMPSA